MMLLMLLGGCRADAVKRCTAHFPPGTGFVRRQLILDGRPHQHWVFIPKDYSAQRRYPAIVFLHGLFEAGRDGDSALSAGLGPVIAKSPDTWPFNTVFPQSDGTWGGERWQRRRAPNTPPQNSVARIE